MTLFSDEAMLKQLEEYSATLEDMAPFLDQVKERVELLVGESGDARTDSQDSQDALRDAEDRNTAHVRMILDEVSHDQAVLIDWALDAGADPAAVKGLKNSTIIGALEDRAKARAAF